MPVVIDGNNLLHAALNTDSTELQIGRSMLCNMIGSWARREGARVRVVFDGPAPNAALATQIGHPDIEVMYSGGGVSADSVIINIVETDSAARLLRVVSSDRAIQKVVRRRQATVVRAEEFWRAIKADLARPEPKRSEPEEKEVGLSPDATQQWLDEFGLR